MPTYDYRCPSGHVTESAQPVGTATIACECGHQAERQLPAQFSGRFSGEGFTRTGC